jgi:hypothetical protein
MIINGCVYEVDICVKCALGPEPPEIYIRGFSNIILSPPCTQTWSIQEVLNYITNQISTFTFIYTELCSPLYPIPPCPTLSVTHTYRHWVCWKKELIQVFGITKMYYSPCDYDSWCEEEIQYCYDPIANVYQRHRTNGPTLIGSISCTLEGSQVPDPEEIEEESECWIYHTPCNPFK